MVHGVTDDPERPGLLMGTGLGFFPYGMLDQHFIKRGRLGRLVVAMARAGVRRGFGIDENTALLVEGAAARVCGEYGVMLVDIGPASVDDGGRSFADFRLSYLDDGDSIELARFRPSPAPASAGCAGARSPTAPPARSRRNVFGAYTLYDLMTRLVLGDPRGLRPPTAPRPSTPAPGSTSPSSSSASPAAPAALIATPETGLRMTALNFRCSIRSEQLSATRIADRLGRRARTYGMTPNPEAQIVLLGSSPLSSAPEMLARPLALVGAGPGRRLRRRLGRAARAPPTSISRCSPRHGVQAVDLGVTIDTVDYADAGRAICSTASPALRGILLCGGNQIRLVETLLHRGEESAVLRAIARAHAQGAVLIAASGAASALSGVMIAGGSSYEALRYGVSSDTGHRGLVIQEGVGLFGGGIVDQNLIGGNRLGRLVVACAEESERFGIGVFEDSAVIASHAGTRLEAAGRQGFVLVEIDPDRAGAAERQLRRQRHPADRARPRRPRRPRLRPDRAHRARARRDPRRPPRRPRPRRRRQRRDAAARHRPPPDHGGPAPRGRHRADRPHLPAGRERLIRTPVELFGWRDTLSTVPPDLPVDKSGRACPPGAGQARPDYERQSKPHPSRPPPWATDDGPGH